MKRLLNPAKKFSAILLGCTMALMSACDNFLHKDPQQSLDVATQYDTEEKVETALIGSYNALQDFTLLGLAFSIFPDIISDNAIWAGSFPRVVDVANRQNNSSSWVMLGTWQQGYSAINAANSVINAVGEIPNFDPELADQLVGEALFIRALVQFEQVRYFSQPYGPTSSSDLGVPIRTEAVLDLSAYENIPRNTVEEVYTQIIDDLTLAISTLPDANSIGRANKSAAIALLARVRFQRREYSDAASLALQIISGGYSLNSGVTDFYTNEFSGESIFELENTVQDNSGITFWTHRLLRDGDTRISSDMVSSGFGGIVTPPQQSAITAMGYSYEDERVTLLTEDSQGNLGGQVHSLKYEDNVNAADNSYMIRLAEFMLMRAESLVLVNNSINQEAIDLLNEVRLRAIKVYDSGGNLVDATPYVAFSASDFATPLELQEAVILERRVELFLEGNRYHDLVRLNRQVRSLSPGADNLVWPIPQRAIQTNPLLVQNPGY